jgi:hypothetical protein
MRNKGRASTNAEQARLRDGRVRRNGHAGSNRPVRGTGAKAPTGACVELRARKYGRASITGRMRGTSAKASTGACAERVRTHQRARAWSSACAETGTQASLQAPAFPRPASLSRLKACSKIFFGRKRALGSAQASKGACAGRVR